MVTLGEIRTFVQTRETGQNNATFVLVVLFVVDFAGADV